MCIKRDVFKSIHRVITIKYVLYFLSVTNAQKPEIIMRTREK